LDIRNLSAGILESEYNIGEMLSTTSADPGSVMPDLKYCRKVIIIKTGITIRLRSSILYLITGDSLLRLNKRILHNIKTTKICQKECKRVTPRAYKKS
jgi:hypothetical protein